MTTNNHTTGTVTNIQRLKSSANGNPRYTFELNGTTYRTGVDNMLGYGLTNYEDKLVTMTHRTLYGYNTATNMYLVD